jgi:hypothetical protein
MIDANEVISLTALPDDATYAEAMEWLRRMRRVLDRWDTLPDAGRWHMTPDARREVNAELDVLEERIRRDMTMAVS